VTGKIYQTLPLYENLHTSGVYVYPQAIDLEAKKTADVKVEAEVTNESGDYASITLSAVVVDADGVVRAQLDRQHVRLVGGQTESLHRLRLADRRPFLGCRTTRIFISVYSI
jgi:beta-galactosidase